MKYLLIVAGLFFATFLNAYAFNIEGTYDCKATEMDGKTTSTGVSTLKKTGDTYVLDSKFTDGSAYHAVGLYDEKNRILSLASINTNDKAEIGVTLAHMESNGTVKAEWSDIDKTAVGHSTCTKRG